MEPISEELRTVLAKVGPVGGSHIHIAGRPYGVHVDVTPDDLRVIIDEIGKIPMLTNRDIRVTNLELLRTFGDQETTNRFMFVCCLLQNRYKSPIFTIHPEGNYDRINYQGEMKNVVFEFEQEEAPATEVKVKVDETASTETKVEPGGTLDAATDIQIPASDSLKATVLDDTDASKTTDLSAASTGQEISKVETSKSEKEKAAQPKPKKPKPGTEDKKQK